MKILVKAGKYNPYFTQCFNTFIANNDIKKLLSITITLFKFKE